MLKGLIPVILIAMISVASCSRSGRTVPETPTPDPGYVYSMSSVYAQLKNNPKFVKIDPTIGGSFYTVKGTQINIPANAFQTATGGTVIDSVQIEVTEYLKRGDWIFSRVLPVNNGNSVISGGEIYVNATETGAQLVLAPGKVFTASLPQYGRISSGLYIFHGQMVNSGINPINWLIGDTSIGALPSVACNFDTVVITSDSLGYTSANKYLPNPAYQSFTLTVNGVSFNDSDHVQAYALFDNYNAIYPMTGRYHQVFTETHVPNFPLHFVVYTVYQGKFYGGVSSSSVTPLTGGNYTVNLTEVNPITFLGQVNAM